MLDQGAGHIGKESERVESLERQVKDLTSQVQGLTERLERTNRQMLIVMERIAVEQILQEERREKKERKRKMRALEDELAGLQGKLRVKRQKM